MRRQTGIYESHIRAQLSLLESLERGESPVDVAKSARELILSTYGITPRGPEIAIAVNEACNLRCKHCYYASTHSPNKDVSSATLSEDQWRQTVRSAIGAGLTHLAIVGKEPLLSGYTHLTFAILEELKRAKEKNPEIAYDLTTNGTCIEQNIDRIKGVNSFDSFTISFDGTEEIHDYVRGKGAYNKARRGLELVSGAGITNRNISTTVMPANIQVLDTMAHELASAGAQTLTFNICFPTTYNQQDLVSNRDIFYMLLEKTKKMPSSLDLSIILRGDVHASVIAGLYKSGFFQNNPLASTEDIAPAVFTLLSSNPPRAVQTSFLPLAFYGGFRINANGDAVDYSASFERSSNNFGNVKKNSISDIYKFAREELWVPYTETYFMRLADAFNGKRLGPLTSRVVSKLD